MIWLTSCGLRYTEIDWLSSRKIVNSEAGDGEDAKDLPN